MSNRWLRFGIALLAIGAAGAAAYRIFEQEHRRTAQMAVARLADGSAEAALVTVSELKAALHAYVAEGQGDAFWTARAATLIDRLRTAILELEAPAAAADMTLTEALDLTDRLAAAEGRARDHARRDENLLAGEVIFIEARDMLDAIRLQVARARSSVGSAAAAADVQIRREQAMLALGVIGVLAFATLLLVIPGRADAPGIAPEASPRTADPADEFESSARVISRTPLHPTAPGPAVTPGASRAVGAAGPLGAPAAGVTRSASGGAAARTASSTPGARTGSGTAVATAAGTVAAGSRSTPAPPAPPGGASLNLREAAAVCTDLGRVSQSIEISGLLQRAATVLNASGVIVWMASDDGRALFPAASAGYDDRLLARIGAIPRDANNVTAGALRDAATRTSSGAGTSAAALAVPLMTPLGPVGVFSAEIREVAEVDEARMAVAMIFAAQFASLVGSMAGPATASSGDNADATHPAKAQA